MNIVGNGLIATAFKNNIEENNYSDWIIFASGVSNSQDDDEDSFSRENKLLKKLSANKRIVYFSTCSVNIPKEYHTRYIKHKLEIENMFNLKKDLVIRLSNVVGENGNRKNIVNYFIESIQNHQLINLQKNAERNLIGISEVVKVVKLLMDSNCSGVYEVGSNKNYKVIEIIKEIEKLLGITAKIDLNSGGYSIPVDLGKVTTAIPSYNSFFKNDYLKSMLIKKIKEYQ